MQANEFLNLTSEQAAKKIGELCKKDYKNSGILASVSAAQMILESGYVKSELAQNANNCFGMKKSLSNNTWSSNAWDGVSVYVKRTSEQNTDGTVYYIEAEFRKYTSIENSIEDHSAYLLGAKSGSKLRYEGLKGEKDYKKAIQIIKDGGYATDISYVSKVCNIIEKYNLARYDVIEGGNVMSYSNSTLVDCTVKSPNHSGTRTHKIDRITPHCVVGQVSAESIGQCFLPVSRQASCNYGIGKDGRVCLIVDEANRSWCSSSNENDQRAITIECASDMTSPYAMNSIVYNKLVDLCVDICKRNGINKLLWIMDKEKSLNYAPKTGEAVITVHRWFAAKECPGDWLYNRLGDLANTVTSKLGGSTSMSSCNTSTSASNGNTSSSYTTNTTIVTKFPEVPFTVDVVVSDLNYRSTGSMTGKVLGQTGKGTFTITEVKNGWGKLKSGAGWIYLRNPSYCTIGNTVKTVTESKTSVPYVCSVHNPLSIYKGPGTNYGKTGKRTRAGTYTIIQESAGTGSTKGWGKLKSGTGWISLDTCIKK